MGERPTGDKRISRYGLPQPKICHLELDEASVLDKAVFVIGDVHGCYDELCDLMQKARELEDNILFVFVGDLVNRGPNSKEVVRLLRQSDACLSVRGNHEETTLREYAKLSKDPDYELPARYNYIRCFDEEDIQYLQELPYTISIPSLKALFVHAGLEPGIALEEQCLYVMTHMRSLILEEHGRKHVPTNKTTTGVPWGSLWPGPYHVYYGHDKRRGYQSYKFATGLDTGCVHGGHMTGQFITGHCQRLAIKSRDVYWPDNDD